MWYNVRVRLRVTTNVGKRYTMFNNVSNAKVRMSGEKMHQTDRNKMRADVIAEIMEVMHKNGVECGLVHDGIAVNIPHEDLGCINFVVDVKMKNADYDYDFEVEDYQKEQAIKAEKAKAQKACLLACHLCGAKAK